MDEFTEKLNDRRVKFTIGAIVILLIILTASTGIPQLITLISSIVSFFGRFINLISA